MNSSSTIINNYYKQAIEYVNKNDYLSSVDIYKKILNEPLNITDKNKYLMELGNIYEKLDMYYKAITECYVIIIQSEPYNGVILNQIGVCYSNINDIKLAIHYFKKVLNIAEIPDVYCNIGVCYQKINDYDNAELQFFKAHKLDINNSKIIHGLANIYYINKKYDKAIEYFNKIKGYNDNPQMMYDTAFSQLGKQNFEAGFKLYECRLLFNNINPQTKLIERLEIPSIKLWDGNGKCNKLLIVSEQGFGDNIQYYRFIVELSHVYPDMVIHYFCKKEIAHLFKTYKNIHIIDNVIINTFDSNNNPIFTYDYKIYIMSLPFILRLDKIHPNKVNYINTDETMIHKWKDNFKHLKKYKVGFVYNGLLSSFIEKYIPLIDFEIFTDLDIELICIHKKSDILTDISNLSNKVKEKIHFYDIDNDQPFVDTIHILLNIDLLITIDTYIVHLAGILNIKTWLLLGNYSEWRWSNRDVTYWYSSVELIRMKEKKELKNILGVVKKKLMDVLDNQKVNLILDKQKLYESFVYEI